MNLLEGFWSIDPNVRKFFTDEPLNLNDILPKKGDIRIVILPLADYNQEYILWRSPDSEINGWDDTPQEIVCSHVVKCELEIIEDLQLDDELIQWASITKIHRKYQAKIIDVFPFIDFCKSRINPSEMYMSYCGQANGASTLDWADCRESCNFILCILCGWCAVEITPYRIFQSIEDYDRN